MDPTTAGARSADRLRTRTGEGELLAAVQGRSERLGRLQGVKELGKRRSGRTASILSEVLADPEQPATVRAAAAVSLGRQGKAVDQNVLANALEAGDPAVVRRAAEVLGRVGDESALGALESVAPPSGPARRSVQFAKSLLSYRLGIDGNLIRRPPESRLLSASERHSAQVLVEGVESAEVKRMVPDLRFELPGLQVSNDGAVRLVCGENEFLLLYNRELHRRSSPADITQRPFVPAVLLKHSGSLGFALFEYFFTHPRRDGSVQLSGVRGTGDIVHAGEVQIDGEEARFQLRAVDTPTALPVDVEGSYRFAERRLTLTEVAAHPDASRQQLPSEPKKLEPPIPDAHQVGDSLA